MPLIIASYLLPPLRHAFFMIIFAATERHYSPLRLRLITLCYAMLIWLRHVTRH